MSGNDFGRLVARTAVIKGLSALATLPALRRMLPTPRLQRLVETAELEDLKYGGIFSRSSYLPWRADSRFREIFSIVQHNTLVDEYRCYELWTLCSQIGELEPGDLLEVGVWRGGTGCLLAGRCRDLGIAGSVFLCDTFTGVVKAGTQDSIYVGGEHADTSKDVVIGLARRLDLPNVEILQGMFPDETASSIAARRFRLCHIDVDVYELAAQTFEWVWPRLVRGGIVIFDDYGFYSCAGVTRFVDAMRGQPDRLVLYNVNGHGIVIKR